MKKLEGVTKFRSFWIRMIELACVVKIMNSMTVLVIGSLYSEYYGSIEKEMVELNVVPY